jgi:hypothetical protein
MKKNKFDGPIPGENFTSNVKNYPWHRPPSHLSLDDVVGSMVKNLNKPEKTAFVIALLETDQSIVDIVTGLIRIGVANGRMSIDMGILSAGPMARMIEVIAEKAEIDYTRGWDQEPRLITSEMLRARGGKVDPDDIDESSIEVEPSEEEMESLDEGLMTLIDEPAPEEQQQAMLGETVQDDEELV